MNQSANKCAGIHRGRGSHKQQHDAANTRKSGAEAMQQWWRDGKRQTQTTSFKKRYRGIIGCYGQKGDSDPNEAHKIFQKASLAYW
ncbi:MAG: hypothetical protein F9B45_15395 [Phycisphaera sp. RhM]|nr:hypothetical protein [Phycisphaera sp. RhM]